MLHGKTERNLIKHKDIDFTLHCKSDYNQQGFSFFLEDSHSLFMAELSAKIAFSLWATKTNFSQKYARPKNNLYSGKFPFHSFP